MRYESRLLLAACVVVGFAGSTCCAVPYGFAGLDNPLEALAKQYVKTIRSVKDGDGVTGSSDLVDVVCRYVERPAPRAEELQRSLQEQVDHWSSQQLDESATPILQLALALNAARKIEQQDLESAAVDLASLKLYDLDWDKAFPFIVSYLDYCYFVSAGDYERARSILYSVLPKSSRALGSKHTTLIWLCIEAARRASTPGKRDLATSVLHVLKEENSSRSDLERELLTAWCSLVLAEDAFQENEFKEASGYATRSAEILHERTPNSIELVSCHVVAALTECRIGTPEQAKKQVARAEEAYDRAAIKCPSRLAAIWYARAMIAEEDAAYDKGYLLAMKSARLVQSEYGEHHPACAEACLLLTDCCGRLGDFETASDIAGQLAVAMEDQGEHRVQALALHRHGVFLGALGKRKQGLSVLRSARQAYRRGFSAGHPNVSRLNDDMRSLEKTGAGTPRPNKT